MELTFGNVIESKNVQLSLFVNQEKVDKEENLEMCINEVKLKQGKNAIIRGMNLEEGATTMIRNKLIGGHNAE